ncbi:hypothetical protein ITI46_07760 [Streptomyces oryzae]|uniref:Uncharacterized protein n=1 Tax=Streptomyces oryzae TaxID=1434886 RepID=A0ABS3X895_9ACTN|nr:hypothetical protein [Streptomyces oryzae]MBO8191588.1 hypothetical protein [Streptomyces oryzae]
MGDPLLLFGEFSGDEFARRMTDEVCAAPLFGGHVRVEVGMRELSSGGFSGDTSHSELVRDVQDAGPSLGSMRWITSGT